MGMIAKLIIAAVCSYLFNLFCKGYRSLAQARDPLVNGKLRLRNKEQLSWRKGWLLGPWAVAPSFELISCLDLTTGKPEGQVPSKGSDVEKFSQLFSKYVSF